MDKQLENLVKKIMAKDIELEMLKLETEGKVVTSESVLEILKKLTD